MGLSENIGPLKLMFSLPFTLSKFAMSVIFRHPKTITLSIPSIFPIYTSLIMPIVIPMKYRYTNKPSLFTQASIGWLYDELWNSKFHTMSCLSFALYYIYMYIYICPITSPLNPANNPFLLMVKSHHQGRRTMPRNFEYWVGAESSWPMAWSYTDGVICLENLFDRRSK